MEPYQAQQSGGPRVLERLFLLAGLGAGALLFVVAAVYAGERFFGLGRGLPDATPRLVTARGDLAEDERATIELFKAASPGVVHISTSSDPRRSFGRGVYSIDPDARPEGTGSGILWDQAGHVVTNYHVVRDATSCLVRLQGGEAWRAVVIGVAPEVDLAVLRIDAPSRVLAPIPLGTSQDLQVGQKVFAIGNPFGLDRTLTTGIISGLDRTISAERGRRIDGVIQTDAAINPGNSGGPLLDSAGRLIGINTAIASSTGTYSGVGFAVPVNTMNRVVPNLIRGGRSPRAGIGVRLMPDENLAEFGVRGAGILEVLSGTPAERAGLRPLGVAPDGALRLGDVVVRMDGRPVGSAADLLAFLEGRPVGDQVELEILRDGVREPVSLRLESLQ
ncbi:MAG: trypsin-like serine protease [Planctomycetaceae bacterium]|nr:trypsin-like serine protease [Planctomycetaceae bacterium]